MSKAKATAPTPSTIPTLEAAALLEAVIASNVFAAVDLSALFQLQQNLVEALTTSLGPEHAGAAVTALLERALGRLPESIRDSLRMALEEPPCNLCDAFELPGHRAS